MTPINSSRLLYFALLIGLLLVVAPLTGEDWPQFRGSQAGVGMDHPDLPDSWSSSENVVWKIDVPGLGWSSPVISGDHVFLTTVAIVATGAAPRPCLYQVSWPSRNMRSRCL